MFNSCWDKMWYLDFAICCDAFKSRLEKSINKWTKRFFNQLFSYRIQRKKSFLNLPFDCIILYSFPIIVSTTFMLQNPLVLSYYMHSEMLFRIIHFFSFLPGCDEVLNDESQAPHPPTLLFTCFWHCWLGAVTWSIKDDYYVLISQSQINDWSLAITRHLWWIYWICVVGSHYVWSHISYVHYGAKENCK